jgi:hypothetical protein
MACSLLLSLLFITSVFFKFGELTDVDDVQLVMSLEQKRDFIPSFVLLSGVLTATSVGAFAILAAMITVQVAMERARMQREVAESLPTSDWRMAEGQEYVCFLSQCAKRY